MLLSTSLVTDLIILIATLLILLVAYFKWAFSYWSSRGVETPPPSIPFGNVGNLFMGKKNFGEVWSDVYNGFRKKQLPYGGAYFFGVKMFMPTDPELIKHIMQNDFQHFMNHGGYVNEEADPLTGHLFSLANTKWRNLRVKLTPTFTSGKMKMMFQTIADCGSELTGALDKKIEGAVDIKEILSCFSTDIISSCAFGIECNSLQDPETDFRRYGRMISQISFTDMFRILVSVAAPSSILHLIKFKVTKPEVETFFMDAIKKTVEYREKNNIYRKDFLHLLIQLKNLGEVTDDEKIINEKSANIALNINELAAQAFVFFLGGFETSSTTNTFALYEIALNPEIQKKMRKEINTVLQNHDNKLTYDAVMEMTYMDQVIYETLRKYPPLPFLTRECTIDYKVPNSDLLLKKDMGVVISVLGLHYDNEYYPNPVVFDPERFTKENIAARPAFTWLPFGDGPRVCIGQRFGLMQVKVGLATIIQNYEISLNRKTTTPLRFTTNEFILTGEGGVWLNMKKITK